MTEITLHNYEAFLLDHSEGNLNAGDTAALLSFIAAHPELEISLSGPALPVLPEETTPVDFKHNLKKSEDNLPDEAVLDYLEGNLLPEEKIAFEKKLVEDSELAEDLELYKKTILLPETGVAFDAKAGLLKTGDDVILNNRIVSYVENQLTTSEKTELEQELKTNVALQKELTLVLKTKLIADPELVYPNKTELKKEAAVIALFSFRTLVTTAAAVLLLAGLVVLFTVFYSKPAKIKEVAGKKQEAPKQDIPKQQLAVVRSKEHLSAHDEAAVKSVNNNVPAGKIIPQQKPAAAKKDTFMISSQSETPAVAVVQQKEELPLPAVEKDHRLLQSNLALEEKTTSRLSSDSILKSDAAGLTHLELLATVEEKDDDEPVIAEKRFWQRVARLAKRANQLGVKSVDGEEKPGNSYFLSFNSFSVEKK